MVKSNSRRKLENPQTKMDGSKKRYRGGGGGGGGGGRRTIHLDQDVHIESSDEDQDEQLAVNDVDVDSESSSSEEEDLAAKKVRLARDYLQRVEAEDGSEEEGDDNGGDDDDDNDNDGDDNVDKERLGVQDKVSRKLRHRRMEQMGTEQVAMADTISQKVREIKLSLPENTQKAWVSAGNIQLLKGHDLPLTCVALDTKEGSRAVSGSKDHSVLLWDIETNKKLATICPHWKAENNKQQLSSSARTLGQVLSVACSDDGRYAAVGSRDATVRIYDVRTFASSSSSSTAAAAAACTCVKEFKGHKGPVTALCFQTKSLQLFSASEDRLIRSYNLQEMIQLETLYGHQLGVTALDCMTKERPVSVGRDRTARAWKLDQDTHMIYRGGSLVPAASCVSLIQEDWFLSGHEDNGQVSLWSTDKKKPVATWLPPTPTPPTPPPMAPVAAAAATKGSSALSSCVVDRSVVSIAALRRSDLAFTGSSDGQLRLWRVRTGASKAEGRDIAPLEGANIPLDGYLNGIAVGPGARFALVAVGNEHRLGRWNPMPKVKNRLAIVHFAAGSSDGTAVPPPSNQQPSHA